MRPQIEAGSTIFIEVEVRDAGLRSNPLADPADGVTITVTNPNGVDVVVNAPMSSLGSGRYTYNHSTTVNDLKGYWAISFKASEGSAVTISQNYQAFELV